MAKNNTTKNILIIILTVLIIASGWFYVGDIILNGTPLTDNLFQLLAAVFICIGSLIRLLTAKGRRSLEFYEHQYNQHIEHAFSNSPFYKKKLLCAIRLYNEDNFKKALKYLLELKSVCKEKEDLYAVGLFTGIVLTDMGLQDDAVHVYNALINLNITSSTIYGNLGSVYSNMGNYNDAIAALRLAIQNDRNNPAPYNNLAKLYFDTYDFENAKHYAHKALDINHKFRQSASMLTIIYSLENDTENTEKYFHIAISSGSDPSELQQAIKYYKSEKAQNNSSPNSDADDE